MRYLILFLLFISCTDSREKTNNVYLSISGADIEKAKSIQSIILKDLSRFSCIRPKDWKVKLPDSPCSNVEAYNDQKLDYLKDYLVKITIDSPKSYSIVFYNNRGRDKLERSSNLGSFTIKGVEVANSKEFAQDILSSPVKIIGYK